MTKIEDGTDFAIELGAVKPCFVYPDTLRSAEACDGMNAAPRGIAAPPATAESRALAVALVRLEGDNVGYLAITRYVPPVVAPDAEEAKRFVTGFARGARAAAPNATVDVREGQLIDVAGTKGARGAVSIGGVPVDDPRRALLEYQAVSAIYGEKAVYTVNVGGPLLMRDKIEGLLDRVLPLATVARSQAPASTRAEVSRDGASIRTAALAGIVVVVAIYVVLKRRALRVQRASSVKSEAMEQLAEARKKTKRKRKALDRPRREP